MGNLFKTLLNEKIISIEFGDKSDLKNSPSQSVPEKASVEKQKKWAQIVEPEAMNADILLSSDEKMKQQIIIQRAKLNKGNIGDVLPKTGLASKSTEPANPRQVSAASARKLGNITKFPVVPSKRRNDLLAASQPSSIIAETFRVIRTLLLMKIKERGLKTVLVTSSLPLEGKSFVASNLAVSVARDFDKYVLLVDADVKRPTLHEIFKAKSKVGLTEYLMNGHHKLDELIQSEILTKLSFLPAGSFHDNSSELLASQKMKQLMNEVKYRYDDRYIIIDSPPAQISETLALANIVDGVLLVVRAGYTAKKLVKKTVQVLGKDKILGVVLNQCNVTPKAYYQYYTKQ